MRGGRVEFNLDSKPIWIFARAHVVLAWGDFKLKYDAGNHPPSGKSRR
jgi:hypothetical protein